MIPSPMNPTDDDDIFNAIGAWMRAKEFFGPRRDEKLLSR